MNASILTIGNELVSGFTLDTNSAWLGQKLIPYNIQVEKVLICFLREVFSGDLGQIDQKGWDNFELLRVSPKARIRFGTDICIQMLHKANDNLKSKVKEKDQHITHSLRSPSSGKLPLLHLDYVSQVFSIYHLSP